MHTAAAQLDKNQLIRYDRASGQLQSTELGRIACTFYITYKSMATYLTGMELVYLSFEAVLQNNVTLKQIMRFENCYFLLENFCTDRALNEISPFCDVVK